MLELEWSVGSHYRGVAAVSTGSYQLSRREVELGSAVRAFDL